MVWRCLVDEVEWAGVLGDGGLRVGCQDYQGNLLEGGEGRVGCVEGQALSCELGLRDYKDT